MQAEIVDHVKVSKVIELKNVYLEQRNNIDKDILTLENRLRELRSNREAHEGALAAVDAVIKLAEHTPVDIGQTIEDING